MLLMIVYWVLIRHNSNGRCSCWDYVIVLSASSLFLCENWYLFSLLIREHMLLTLGIARQSGSGRFIISVMVIMIPPSGAAPGPPGGAFPHMTTSGPTITGGKSRVLHSCLFHMEVDSEVRGWLTATQLRCLGKWESVGK